MTRTMPSTRMVTTGSSVKIFTPSWENSMEPDKGGYGSSLQLGGGGYWGGTLPSTGVDGSIQVKSGYGVPERGTLARYYDCITKRTGGACTGHTDMMVTHGGSWQARRTQNTVTVRPRVRDACSQA
jgi:hypothetical protein